MPSTYRGAGTQAGTRGHKGDRDVQRIVVRLLGALDVSYGTERLTVPAGRPRALLAALALRHGELVPVEEITERLWGADPPAAARTTVRGHVKRLRRVLDAARDGAGSVVDGERGGYRLSRDRVTVDTTEFRDRARGATALRAARPDAEAAALDRALDLWRGPALEGIDAPSLHRDVVPSLEELRLRVVHRRIAIGLELEDPADHIPRLREMLAADPLQERFWAQLILALYRSGRPAEALREYARCRRLLGERLGVDPGREVRELHQQILVGGPALTAAVRPGAPAGGLGRYVPRQLPADDVPFVGRSDELAALDGELLGDGDGRAMDFTGRVLLLDGPAGVGKTALAVHWANRRRELFPDGQIYLDLAGFSTRRPMSADDALHALLVGLGAAGHDLPAGTYERSALLRSALAGRRILLVLDNVLRPEQIRPLLPGPAGITLVTSRNQLRGLVVRNGARRLTLTPLGLEQAVVLLQALLSDTHGTEPDSLRELAALCGGLPLALRILAERAALRPEVSLARLVGEIRGEREPLGTFQLGEDSTDLRTVMSWSLRGLTDAAARLHNVLAQNAGVPVCPADAAAVLGVPERTAALLLDELAQIHLVERHSSDRYRLPPVFLAHRDRRLQAMTAGRA